MTCTLPTFLPLGGITTPPPLLTDQAQTAAQACKLTSGHVRSAEQRPWKAYPGQLNKPSADNLRHAQTPQGRTVSLQGRSFVALRHVVQLWLHRSMAFES